MKSRANRYWIKAVFFLLASFGFPISSIAQNIAPTVSLTAPTAGAVFTAPANITLAATAADSDGTVTKVEFFRGTTLIGTDTTAPYSFAWNSVAAGSYSLTAKATDNLGATKTSTAVAIIVNALPTATLTAPANGATFVPPASIALTATATDSDGTIAKVEFFNGATLIATDTTSPYSFTWASVASGSYTLTAKSTDNRGGTTTSSPVAITVNALPTVSLTAPAAGAVFSAPANITMTAIAADSDGTVSKVEFFNGATLLGTSTTSPYTFTWSNVAAGSYSLTAKATDNRGATKTSTAVAIIVNTLPTATLTAPANGATFVPPASIALTATATDSDGTIAKVEFFNGSTLIATDTTSPYSFTWASVASGSYTLTVKATDNRGGATTSSPIAITVNALPTVSLTAPAAGAVFSAPANVTMTATAADSDGTISKVEFFSGATLLGTSTTSPFTFTWSNVAAGSYSLTAKATDNLGGVKTSTAIAITVNSLPTVSLTAPANGAIFSPPANVTLTATATDSDGTITKVEFFNGATLLGTDTTSPYSFAWNSVTTGSYTLTAKATDNRNGVSTSAPVMVIVNAQPTVTLTAPSAGATFVAPATINLTANASDSDGTITKVEFFNGATLLGTDTTVPYSFSWTSVPQGSYGLTAKATDSLGAVVTSTSVNVTVSAPNVAPTVSLTAPASGATFTAPAAVALTATASDSDGTVTKVEFYSGATLLGSATTSPYSYNWANVPAGSYSLTARATDNNSAVTTSAVVAITVGAANTPPSVSLTGPANGATFSAPATIPLSANASDSDGTISKVEFFNGATLLGTATTAPYTYTWANVASGTYTLTAKATDNQGAITSSSAISVVVNGSAANGPINFVYDEDGRLVGVSDVNGASARYQYDSVGNIVRIGRGTAGDVTILGFSPATGPVGTTVTISGTGFSTTTSDNAVRFAGRAAAIISATATQLTVSVPAGSVDGPINVTAPSGSATTSTNFIVAGSSNLPTITSFTPTSGTPDTTITITGTNFDPILEYNRVSLNGKSITLTSANTTTLVGTLPVDAVFGKIKVLTPKGTTTSSQYFYVAPFGSALASIETMGTVTIGGTATVSTNTAGGQGLLIFEGNSGQHVQVKIIDVNYANCSNANYGYLSLYDPNGQKLTSITACHNAYLDVTLPVTGSYGVLIDPFGADTGSLTFAIDNAPADITGTIVADGSTTTITTTLPGQNARLAFTATAGQRVVLQSKGGSFDCSQVSPSIIGPDGVPLVRGFDLCGYSPLVASIGQTGQYFVLIDPQSKAIGNVSVSLTVVPELTGTIAIGGPAVDVTSAIAGQSASLNFNAVLGQYVFLRVNGGGGYCFGKTIAIFYGSKSLGSTFGCGGGLIGPVPITVSGTYSVKIDPVEQNIGSLSLQLTDVPPIIGTITIGGSPVAVSLPNVGQIARLEFNGTVGQHVKLTAVSSTIGDYCTEAKIIDAENWPMIDNCLQSGGVLEATLSSTGMYTIVITPLPTQTGNITLSLSEIVDVQGAILIDGPAATLTTLAAGQNAQLFFTGTAGQRVYAKVESSTFGNCSAGKLGLVPIKPLAENPTDLCPLSFSIVFKLPRSGTYVLSIDPYDIDVGVTSVSLHEPLPDVISNTIIDAPAVTLATSIGQRALLKFSGSAGQRLRVAVAGSTYPNCNAASARILDPNSSFVQVGDIFNLDVTVNVNGCLGSDVFTLRSTGEYALVVDASAVGSAEWSIKSVSEVLGTIVPDGTIATIGTIAASQIGRLTFNATAGQHVKLDVVSSTYSDCQGGQIKILDPSGGIVLYFYNTINICAGSTLETLLPVAGPYSVLIEPYYGNAGSVTLQMTSITDVHGTITIGGAPVSIATTGSDVNGILDFAGAGGQRVSALVSNSTYPNCSAQILNPSYFSINGAYNGGVCAGSFIEPTLLPTTGSYKLLLRGTSATPGTANVAIFDVPPDVNGSLVLNGTSTDVTITAPGQIARFAFNAPAGTNFTAHVINNTQGCVRVSFEQTQYWTVSCANAFSISGTYAANLTGLTPVLVIDPEGPLIGTFNVQVSSP